MKKSFVVPVFKSVSFLLVVCLLAGCNGVRYSREEAARFQKPTIGVAAFEVMTTGNWNASLGADFADQLSDRLRETNRYDVLDREQVSAIFAGLNNSAASQLRGIDYVIKGKVTDFGHTQMHELFGKQTYALTAVQVSVHDVANNRTIAQEALVAKVKPRKAEAMPSAGTTPFGSFSFYQTSVGKATNDILGQAVQAVAAAIEEVPYQPKIASIANNQIVINGGRDRNIAVGDMFVVRPAPRQVTDPDTGQIIGQVTGSIIGTVKIVQVTDKYAIAKILSGNQFAIGQTLFPFDADAVKEKPLRQSPAAPSY